MEIPISKKGGCRRKALKETSWLHGVNQIWQILTKHCVWCATKDSPAVILAKGAKHIVLQKSKKGQKILDVQISKSCASSSPSTSKTTNTLVAFWDEDLQNWDFVDD